MPQNEIAQAVVDDDEAVADLALEGRIFHLLPHIIFENPAVNREEFYFRRFHQLITDFIVLMPLKVKELRNRADDAARYVVFREEEEGRQSIVSGVVCFI